MSHLGVSVTCLFGSIHESDEDAEKPENMENMTDTKKIVQMKTYCVQNEDQISNIIKNDTKAIKIVFKNIKKRFNIKSCSTEKDYFLFEASIEASPIPLQSNAFDMNFIIMFVNVKNEFGEFFSSLVDHVSENDIIVIIDAIKVTKNYKYHVYVRPENNPSVFLFKLNSVSFESNLLTDKNLSKISGTGIYSLFGFVRQTAISADRECMWLRIKCSDASCVNILRYPFATFDTRKRKYYKKCSNHVDILVENSCDDFISLIHGQQIFLRNVKVNRVDNSDCFLLCVQGTTDHLKTIKIEKESDYPTPLQHRTSILNKSTPTAEPKANHGSIHARLKPLSTSYSNDKCTPSSSFNNHEKSLLCHGGESSSNFVHNVDNNVKKRICFSEEINLNYSSRKITKRNSQTDTEVNKFKSVTTSIEIRKCSPHVEGMYFFLPSNNPDVSESSICNPGPHQQVLHMSYIDGEKSLRGCGIRCIGPCRLINIEPYLVLDDTDSSDFLSGYCGKCFSFTPKSYLKTCGTYLKEEYSCSKCSNIVNLTFFFNLSFLYGKNESQVIKICCYSEKAELFFKILSNKKIKVEDYSLNRNCRKLVVDTIRKCILARTKVNVVVLNSPLDNAFILVSISTKNILNT